MARKRSEDSEILRLVQLAEHSRAVLEAEAARLRHQFDVPARIRDSLKHHPSSWLFGSAATGLFASLMLRRKPKAATAPVAAKSHGLAASLLRLTLTSAAPIAKIWLTNQLQHWLAAKAASRPARQSPSNPF
jgi:hypothetical protein